MPASTRWAVANSPKSFEKPVHPAGGQSRPPLQGYVGISLGVGADDSVGPFGMLRIHRRVSKKSCNLPGQKEAKSVYAHTTAAVLRTKDCVMQAVTAVRKGADDVYADAKAINDRRAAEAEPETIEDTAAEAE